MSSNVAVGCCRVTTFIGLLRGINVGGRNRVAMADLRTLLSGMGYDSVRTHLQSGNALFESADADASRLAADIEHEVAASLGVASRVIVRSADELGALIAGNPFVDDEDDLAKLHVAFLAVTPDSARVAGFAVPEGGSERYSLTGRDLYLHYPHGYGRSKLDLAFLERRLGVVATNRNWRTVTKLHELATS